MGRYLYKIDLDWDVPSGSAFDIFEIWVDFGRGFNIAGSTKATDYTYTVAEENLGKPHSFKVIAVSATGKKLEIGQAETVSATPERKVNRPSNVPGLSIDILGEALQLVWPPVSDTDIDEYVIKFSPLVTGATWETSSVLIRASRTSTLYSTQARTGTYLIKAVDFNGNESEIATTAITTIPNLFNLNLIEETADFPTLPGNFLQTVNSSGNIMLDKRILESVDNTEFYSEGTYTFYNLLDLGENYTVRLQSTILAEGFMEADVMSNWTVLDEAELLSNSGYKEWDVVAEYRTTSSLSLSSGWSSLDDVLTMSAGDSDGWTPWRPFKITDATGKLFQFRLKLISNAPGVSPKVLNAVIKADMPDRVESYNNITCPTTGYTVTYSPAFKGPSPSPSVQISADNMLSGDRWEFTDKDVEGFTIMFFDKDDIPVSRVFDANIKGYGRKAVTAI